MDMLTFLTGLAVTGWLLALLWCVLMLAIVVREKDLNTVGCAVLLTFPGLGMFGVCTAALLGLLL